MATAQDYYDRYWSEAGYNPRRTEAPESLRFLFQRYIGIGDDCLDLGCGDGGTSGVYLTEHARSYTGVDVSKTAIEVAQGRGFDAVLIDDASALPFETGSFDVVVCSEVLEHLFEPQLAAAEALRVLRPGGHLLITVPNVAHWRDRVDALFGAWSPGGDDLGRAEPWRSPHIRFFRPKTLQRMLLNAGFDRVEVTGLHSPLLGRVPVLYKFASRPGMLGRAATRIAPSLLATNVVAIGKKESA